MGRRRAVFLFALFLLSAWLVFNWADSIAHVVGDYTALPVFDYWRVIQNVHDYRTLNFSVLWGQHNEHRILFPEIIFAIDMLFLRGRQLLPLVLSFACYFGVGLVVSVLLWREEAFPAGTRIVAALVGGILIAWPLNSMVLSVPFLLNWTLSQFAVILALLFLVRRKVSCRSIYLALAIACGYIATFSSGNGMLLWLVLLLVGLALHLPNKDLLTIGGSAGLAVLLFLFHYQFTSHLSWWNLIAHPLAYALFVLAYLSMPFGVIHNPLIGTFFGALHLALWICIFVGFLRDKRTRTPFFFLSLGYFLFLLFTACLTAMGRMNLGDPGFIAAKAPRYVTLPLVGWALAIQALLMLSVLRKWRPFTPAVIGVVTIVLVGFFQVRLDRWLHTDDVGAQNRQITALSIESGLEERNLLNSIFPKPQFVVRNLPVLQKNHLSIYAGLLPNILGQNASLRFRERHESGRLGIITHIAEMASGYEVRGTIPPPQKCGGCRDILLVNASNVIVGFGTVLSTPFQLKSLLQKSPASLDWVGFIDKTYGSTTVSAYLLTMKNRAILPITENTTLQPRTK